MNFLFNVYCISTTKQSKAIKMEANAKMIDAILNSPNNKTDDNKGEHWQYSYLLKQFEFRFRRRISRRTRQINKDIQWMCIYLRKYPNGQFHRFLDLLNID